MENEEVNFEKKERDVFGTIITIVAYLFLAGLVFGLLENLGIINLFPGW